MGFSERDAVAHKVQTGELHTIVFFITDFLSTEVKLEFETIKMINFE